MRIPPTILSALLVCLGAVSAGAEGAEEAVQAQERRTRAVLAPRYLPQVVDPQSPIATFVDAARPSPDPGASEPRRRSLLTRVLQLRLRGLTGPTPPDPRQQVGIGDVALRLPLGDSLDLRPGVRVDYGRSPEADLWTGEPTPTLGVGMRF